MQKTHGKFDLLALGLISLVVFSVLVQAPPGESGLAMIAGNGQTSALFEVLNASQEQSLRALTGLANGSVAGTELPNASLRPSCGPCCEWICFGDPMQCKCFCIK